jgi:hypothetical protein
MTTQQYKLHSAKPLFLFVILLCIGLVINAQRFEFEFSVPVSNLSSPSPAIIDADIIKAFNVDYGTKTMVVFYERRTGRAKFYELKTQDQYLTDITRTATLPKGLTQIEFSKSIRGRNTVLLYNKATGMSRVGEIHKSGMFHTSPVRNMPRNAIVDIIPSRQFENLGIWYQPNNGRLLMYKLSKRQNYVDRRPAVENIPTKATHIRDFKIGSKQFLFFFNNITNESYTYQISSGATKLIFRSQATLSLNKYIRDVEIFYIDGKPYVLFYEVDEVFIQSIRTDDEYMGKIGNLILPTFGNPYSSQFSFGNFVPEYSDFSIVDNGKIERCIAYVSRSKAPRVTKRAMLHSFALVDGSPGVRQLKLPRPNTKMYLYVTNSTDKHYLNLNNTADNPPANTLAFPTYQVKVSSTPSTEWNVESTETQKNGHLVINSEQYSRISSGEKGDSSSGDLRKQLIGGTWQRTENFVQMKAAMTMVLGRGTFTGTPNEQGVDPINNPEHRKWYLVAPGRTEPWKVDENKIGKSHSFIGLEGNTFFIRVKDGNTWQYLTLFNNEKVMVNRLPRNKAEWDKNGWKFLWKFHISN